MVVAAIVCGGAVADVEEVSVVSALHRPCSSSVCSSSQQDLIDGVFLLKDVNRKSYRRMFTVPIARMGIHQYILY